MKKPDQIDPLEILLLLREDLKVLGFSRRVNKKAFHLWLISNGFKEYPTLFCNESIQTLFLKMGFGKKKLLNYFQWLIWSSRSDLKSAFPLPRCYELLRNWFDTHGRLEYVTPSINIELPEIRNFKTRQSLDRFGANLIGYAYGELGIGEDVRMAAKALIAAKVPFRILNFNPGDNISQNDMEMHNCVSETTPFSINIICLSALENGHYYLKSSSIKYEDCYNIGYWPWELSRWPKEWEILFNLVDEVWVSSRHTFSALSRVCPKPVYLMPIAAELPSLPVLKNKKTIRKALNLPNSAKLFCFSFDLNSSIHRKNPNACVKAFLQAFPLDKYSENLVGLVIKTHKPANYCHEWEKLKKLALEDSRIYIVEKTLPKNELLELYSSADCFLSLHRAEGFGRGIAEALQLGLHVIATGYSGNVDFCKSPNVDLVKYKMIEIEQGQYPFGAGQLWAEPDVGDAAKLMRVFYEGNYERTHKSYWPEFSLIKVGMRYKKRLNEIKKENAHLFFKKN